MAKIGRNEPCPCGSELKYKKCCLNTSEHSLSIDRQAFQNQALLKQRVAERFDNKVVMTSSEPQDIKMSEVILEFADDMLERTQDKQQREKVIMIACLAWNMALMDKIKRQIALEDMYDKVLAKDDVQAKEDIENILSMLIQRKLVEYPHINRVIADYQYSETKHDRRLDIASMIPQSTL